MSIPLGPSVQSELKKDVASIFESGEAGKLPRLLREYQCNMLDVLEHHHNDIYKYEVITPDFSVGTGTGVNGIEKKSTISTIMCMTLHFFLWCIGLGDRHRTLVAVKMHRQLFAPLQTLCESDDGKVIKLGDLLAGVKDIESQIKDQKKWCFRDSDINELEALTTSINGVVNTSTERFERILYYYTETQLETSSLEMDRERITWDGTGNKLADIITQALFVQKNPLTVDVDDEDKQYVNNDWYGNSNSQLEDNRKITVTNYTEYIINKMNEGVYELNDLHKGFEELRKTLKKTPGETDADLNVLIRAREKIASADSYVASLTECYEQVKLILDDKKLQFDVIKLGLDDAAEKMLKLKEDFAKDYSEVVTMHLEVFFSTGNYDGITGFVSLCENRFKSELEEEVLKDRQVYELFSQTLKDTAQRFIEDKYVGLEQTLKERLESNRQMSFKSYQELKQSFKELRDVFNKAGKMFLAFSPSYGLASEDGTKIDDRVIILSGNIQAILDEEEEVSKEFVACKLQEWSESLKVQLNSFKTSSHGSYEGFQASVCELRDVYDKASEEFTGLTKAISSDYRYELTQENYNAITAPKNEMHYILACVDPIMKAFKPCSRRLDSLENLMNQYQAERKSIDTHYSITTMQSDIRKHQMLRRDFELIVSDLEFSKSYYKTLGCDDSWFNKAHKEYSARATRLLDGVNWFSGIINYKMRAFVDNKANRMASDLRVKLEVIQAATNSDGVENGIVGLGDLLNGMKKDFVEIDKALVFIELEREAVEKKYHETLDAVTKTSEMLFSAQADISAALNVKQRLESLEKRSSTIETTTNSEQQEFFKFTMFGAGIVGYEALKVEIEAIQRTLTQVMGYDGSFLGLNLLEQYNALAESLLLKANVQIESYAARQKEIIEGKIDLMEKDLSSHLKGIQEATSYAELEGKYKELQLFSNKVSNSSSENATDLPLIVLEKQELVLKFDLVVASITKASTDINKALNPIEKAFKAIQDFDGLGQLDTTYNENWDSNEIQDEIDRCDEIKKVMVAVQGAFEDVKKADGSFEINLIAERYEAVISGLESITKYKNSLIAELRKRQLQEKASNILQGLEKAQKDLLQIHTDANRLNPNDKKVYKIQNRKVSNNLFRERTIVKILREAFEKMEDESNKYGCNLLAITEKLEQSTALIDGIKSIIVLKGKESKTKTDTSIDDMFCFSIFTTLFPNIKLDAKIPMVKLNVPTVNNHRARKDLVAQKMLADRRKNSLINKARNDGSKMVPRHMRGNRDTAHFQVGKKGR
jgi:hypothetical protein